MSLAAWIENIFGSMEGLLAVLLAAAVFLGLYIYSSSRLQTARMEVLERIRQSLTLYTQLAGPLAAASSRQLEPLTEHQLTTLLLECKAADRLTESLLEQINAYLRDRDPSRLPLLSESLEREMNGLVRERSELLRRVEAPGFGLGLWLLLKPAVPGLVFAAAVWWCFNLITELKMTGGWSRPEVWCVWLTCMISTLSVYRLAMDARRGLPSAVFYVLHALIAAAALPLLFWREAAIFTLATQLMLYLAGFWFNAAPARKERPYAGHPELLNDFKQQRVLEPAADEQTLPAEPEPLKPRRRGHKERSRS
ncbi:hypothetical protein [Paenibacillus lemnae]|uniref:hypothetical protein n=1 Tax=Paenibacillus lemnae TaxID=1330551 RepID=UPI001B7D6023|nr:hypothetical protein [Paenibacillus lemnae]